MSAFVAIDFETADPGRDSACAVGLVRVEGGAIARREARLIRPPRGVRPDFTAVHGLTWQALKGAPPFAAVWPDLAPVLDGATHLVAHNAPFDRSVLEHCCAAARLPVPKLEWRCTLDLSRRKWPKPHSNKLPDVCARLGIPLAHHDAGSDAEAAALILLALDGRPAPGPPVAPVGSYAAIAPEHRTPAVLNLMADAERLGPEHVADLARAVRRWHARPDPGRPRCDCGRHRPLISSVCSVCAARLAGDP